MLVGIIITHKKAFAGYPAKAFLFNH